MFCDDLGYGDIGCFGARDIATPNIDRLANQGLRLTSFYVAQAVCSASRAALLTGSFPNRIGIFGALGPNANQGISSNEVTLAELFKSRGYVCGMTGKWHLGDRVEFLPLQHGFDDFLGLPYSNDMWPPHHGQPNPPKYPALPLIDGNQTVMIVSNLEDQATLTGRYTERAEAFIAANKDRPFFLYMPHSMPHTPIAASARFRGTSKRGLYGDVIQEIDDSMGRVMTALDRAGVASNTIVIFTSDNGPWLRFGNHGGSAGPLREGKGTMFEGGCREPFVIRWPRRIAAGRSSDALMASVDVWPTLAAAIGGQVPAHKLDGVNQLPFLLDDKAASARTSYVYYYIDDLIAYRDGDWKLIFPHTCGQYREGNPVGADGLPAPAVAKKIELALYNLKDDLGERHDVKAEHPDLVEKLTAAAKAYDAELRANRRPAGRMPKAEARQ
jgi:arylsulfatase